MIVIDGTFSLSCSKCGKIHSFSPEDSNFDLTSTDSDNKMGTRNGYSWEHIFSCDYNGCDNEIEIQYDVTEYPENAFESEEIGIEGGTENSRFDINFQE
jgi:hypothetical protein